MHPMMQRHSKTLFGMLHAERGRIRQGQSFNFFKDEMAIKITISKQMVACDKQKTALVCFWSVKYHTRVFLGMGKARDRRYRAFPG
jgi:uncharacterized Zn-finger protein